eukprot:scaffold101955_cov22-Tisochrysis_lutea.AAC.1
MHGAIQGQAALVCAVAVQRPCSCRDCTRALMPAVCMEQELQIEAVEELCLLVHTNVLNQHRCTVRVTHTHTQVGSHRQGGMQCIPASLKARVQPWLGTGLVKRESDYEQLVEFPPTCSWVNQAQQNLLKLLTSIAVCPGGIMAGGGMLPACEPP